MRGRKAVILSPEASGDTRQNDIFCSRPAILKLNFRNPDHRHDLGLYRCERADERLGRFGQAIEHYARALEIEPRHAPAREALSRLQTRRNGAVQR